MRTAVIDLTDLGTELNADEWYLDLMACLKQELGLAVVSERGGTSALYKAGRSVSSISFGMSF